MEVDLEYKLLKEKNVPIVKLPTTQPWGIRSVWFKDPDGNIVNFHADVKRVSKRIGYLFKISRNNINKYRRD